MHTIFRSYWSCVNLAHIIVRTTSPENIVQVKQKYSATVYEHFQIINNGRKINAPKLNYS